MEVLHGRRVADPYRWLEDPCRPDTAAWLAGQDELFAAHRSRLPGREALRRRIASLLEVGTVSAPAWRGERRFFMRRDPGRPHAVLHTVDPGGACRVLVDPQVLDATGATTLDGWQPDDSGRRLAYQVSTGGDEESRLYVLDVESMATLDGPIDRCRSTQVAWLPDGRGFYYVRRLPPGTGAPGEDGFHRAVFLHRLGDPPDADRLVHHAGGVADGYGVALSGAGRWLTISVWPGVGLPNDLLIADLAADPPDRPRLRTVQRGAPARTAAHVGRDGLLYLVTNRAAPRGRVCVCDPRHPGYDHWRELIPEDPEAVLADLAILDGPGLPTALVLVAWVRTGVSEITVHELTGGRRIGTVPMPGAGSIGGLTQRPEGGHEVWFVYTDYLTPATVWRYDARTGATTVWDRSPGATTVPPARVTRLACRSADGTRVPLLVVEPDGAGTARARPRPTILTGYGGFGRSVRPNFSAEALAWVAAGGVYAVANVRGGGEAGAEWHRAGSRERKQNSFDDFHAAARRLIDDGWTDPDRLAIQGASNGGLMVGAALTQWPRLFAAAACVAPVLDMVRYAKSGRGAAWRGEYGSVEVPEEFDWLLAYSPYHRVEPGVNYPATLFAVFDGDTRVDPSHARKMCAALQWATASCRPVLFRREAGVGHGARALDRSVELAADVLAFLAAQTGLALPDARTRPGFPDLSQPAGLTGDADRVDPVACPGLGDDP